MKGTVVAQVEGLRYDKVFFEGGGGFTDLLLKDFMLPVSLDVTFLCRMKLIPKKWRHCIFPPPNSSGLSVAKGIYIYISWVMWRN
jgi:hypothetical protein